MQSNMEARLIYMKENIWNNRWLQEYFLLLKCSLVSHNTISKFLPQVLDFEIPRVHSDLWHPAAPVAVDCSLLPIFLSRKRSKYIICGNDSKTYLFRHLWPLLFLLPPTSLNHRGSKLISYFNVIMSFFFVGSITSTKVIIHILKE